MPSPLARLASIIFTPLRILRRLIKWLFYCSVIFIVLSNIAVLALRWYAPPTTAFMQAYEWEYKQGTRQTWAPLASISPYLQLAVITAEDQKFPFHDGFDFEQIEKALSEQRKRTRGASTISQQCAKNLFLWNGRSWLRKGIEAYFTLLLELYLPKQRILEIYLNVVEFGPGVYGAEAAALAYFGRDASTLSAEEGARLAAVLPNPKRMSAAKPSAYVRKRTAQIVADGEALGGKAYLLNLQPE